MHLRRSGQSPAVQWHMGNMPTRRKAPRFKTARIDIQAVQKRHSDVLAARVSRVRPPMPSVGVSGSCNRRRKGGPTSGTIEALDLSTEDAWACTLHSLVRCDPNFVSSQEAPLQTQTAVGQGHPAYKSVPISEKNNDDLAEIFRLEYEPKIAGGGKNGSWKQVCMAAGQLLRLAVMCQKVEVESMRESGVLFTAICDRSTVELLVSHYRIRTVCTTVMTKVYCLKKVAEHAKIYFEGRDAILRADAERSRIHLRAIYNVQKALGRQRTTDRQVTDDRVERAALFLPDDFRRCKQRTRKSLDDIMTSFDDFRADVGEASATETSLQMAASKTNGALTLSTFWS